MKPKIMQKPVRTPMQLYQNTHQGNCEALAMVLEEAQQLIAAAATLGVVLTIETVPEQPPAMGRYTLRPKVRLARPWYQVEMQLKKLAEELQLKSGS